MKEKRDEKQIADAKALGSAEFQAMTYIVDGIAMSLDEMARYNEEKAARQAKVVEEINREVKEMVAQADRLHVEEFGYDRARYGESAKQHEARLRSEGKPEQAYAVAKDFQDILKAEGRDENGILIPKNSPEL